MDIHELILRGRFLMADAPGRLRVFELVDGKRNAKDISRATRRHVNSIRRDLTLLANAGLINTVQRNGKTVEKDGFALYEKDPLSKTIPRRYFSQPTRIRQTALVSTNSDSPKKKNSRRSTPLPMPSEQDILDVAKHGEDQVFEFKGQGTDIQKITREIAAMSNTSQGGIVLYGIDDDGNIEGSDLTSQKLDQPLQNSVRSTIDPPVTIKVQAIHVLGDTIIAIVVPPWNRKDVHMHNDKVLIRKGTNVFAAKSSEVRKLFRGEVVV